MTATVIIASAAYVGSELSAEFGQLPPAFLPVASGRLFEFQWRTLSPRFSRIILTVPDDFEVPAADARWLVDHDVEVVRISPQLDLSRSLLRALDRLDLREGELAVYHGDTLFPEIDAAGGDVYFVDRTRHAYRWAQCEVADGRVIHVTAESQPTSGSQTVLSGFFCFADVTELALSLAVSEGFAAALNRYARKRTVRAETADVWLDFGHANSFYTSRASFTTQRAFNDLQIRSGIVWKSSERASRVEAESNWFETVPFELQAHTPQFLGRWREGEREGYRLKYAHMPSLAELFVFAQLPNYAWGHIVDACAEFLAAARQSSADLPVGTADYASMHRQKTFRRLDEWSTATSTDLDSPWRLNGTGLPSLREIADELATIVEAGTDARMTIVHGDFCFSNILYDVRSDSVCVLDPRGQDANDQITVWGDQRYDAAKIMHSSTGLYDLIISRRLVAAKQAPYDLALEVATNSTQRFVESRVREMVDAAYPGELRSIQAMTALLFLSMLPLHDDDPSRQTTMVANALRLYSELKDRS